MALAKIVQTAYQFESVEGSTVTLGNDENGIAVEIVVAGDDADQSVTVEFTIGTDEAIALPRLLSKLNRESGRVTVNPRGPRTKNS